MLDKELLPIYEMPKFGISEQVIVKNRKMEDLEWIDTLYGTYT